MKHFAPILIPTLNRFEHFQGCIESLSRCNYANKSDLFIALDYPLNETHVAGYRKIISYLPKINGFNSLTVIKREENFGARKNLDNVREEIFKHYDKIIVSEDDNEFSPNFLEYINDGLDFYEKKLNVFAICGYNYPIKISKNYNADIYFWKGMSGWGYGIWKNRWEEIDWEIENLKKYLSKEENIKKIDNVAGHLLPALRQIIDTDYITNDTMVTYNLIKKEMYCVFPTISKVRNIGNDGSGLHCGKDLILSEQQIDEGMNMPNFTSNIHENLEINRSLRKYFSRKLYHRFRRKVKRLKYQYFNGHDIIKQDVK